jgi:hypothetical protein
MNYEKILNTISEIQGKLEELKKELSQAQQKEDYNNKDAIEKLEAITKGIPKTEKTEKTKTIDVAFNKYSSSTLHQQDASELFYLEPQGNELYHLKIKGLKNLAGNDSFKLKEIAKGFNFNKISRDTKNITMLEPAIIKFINGKYMVQQKGTLIDYEKEKER